MNNIKTLTVKVAHKEFSLLHQNLPHTHKDGWQALMLLLAAEVIGGFVPTSIIRNSSAGGSCYVLAVDLKRAEDEHERDSLIREAMDLGWESLDNGKSFFISEVKNYLIHLSNGKFTYTLSDIVYSYNSKGINCTEAEVLLLVEKLSLKTFYDKKVTYVPASLNSQFMQPIPRKVEEVIFIRPIL